LKPPKRKRKKSCWSHRKRENNVCQKTSTKRGQAKRGKAWQAIGLRRTSAHQGPNVGGQTTPLTDGGVEDKTLSKEKNQSRIKRPRMGAKEQKAVWHKGTTSKPMSGVQGKRKILECVEGY